MAQAETGFDKVHAARLTALADHLENAETLEVGEFDYSISFQHRGCGTAGCAMGEASLLWPKDLPMTFLSENHGYVPSPTICAFFGLTRDESFHLFQPYQQRTELYGGAELGFYATRYDVAAQIRAFLAIKGAQEPACPHCNDTGAVRSDVEPEGLADCPRCRG